MTAPLRKPSLNLSRSERQQWGTLHTLDFEKADVGERQVLGGMNGRTELLKFMIGKRRSLLRTLRTAKLPPQSGQLLLAETQNLDKNI